MQNILIRPTITEKSMRDAALGRFTFVVNKGANKPDIAKAVKEAFKVDPTTVKTIMVKGKTKRAGKARKIIKEANWKKAVVSLKAGQKIELFDVSEGSNH